MRTRIFFSIVWVSFLILGLFTAPTGQATSSSSDYTLTTADGLALTLSADGRVAGVQVDGQGLVSAPAPALILRDLSRAGQVTTPNLVTNPGFELGFSGWTEALNQGMQVGVVVSPTHSGDHALAFTNTVTTTRVAGYASRLVTVSPGQRYRLSAWFLSSTGYVTYPTGTPPIMQMDIWRRFQPGNGLYVEWLDRSGKSLGEPQLVAPLHSEAYHWRLIRGEVTAPSAARQARAILGARLSDQTLWVDDVAFIPSPEPDVALAGDVAPCPGQDDCLQQTVAITNGLVITITYTAHDDHIAVHGDIADTTGQDRALDVSWGVPLAAGGGTWWDDAHTARPIVDTGFYAHEISAIYDGWLPMSLYPYAGIRLGDVGLALGLPLDRPQLALLALDGASGRYGALFHLGISPQAVKIGPHATFDLMLYRFDPDWGFRDVIARHRALQPEAYTTDLPLYNYIDFKQTHYFTAEGVQQALEHDQGNVYSAQYTGSVLPLGTVPSSEPRPTLDQIMAVVTATLSSPQEEKAALARAIIQSAVVDPNGDWSLRNVSTPPWAHNMWQASWAANMDPDLTNGLASWNLDWRITPAFTATTEANAHLDGVEIDNFMTAPVLDLRSEALAAADWPLTYTPHTYQPAVHNGFAMREYLAFLRGYLDANWGTDRGITINFWGLGHPNYLAEYIDGFGSEGSVESNGEGINWNQEILDYRRAIAYGRPYLFANHTPALTASEAHTFTQLALLYGVVSKSCSADWEPEAQQIMTDTMQLVMRYWAAGWEPVTYARADNEHVWLERFGQAGATPQPRAENGLYFTIHNRSDSTRTAAITIETVPLGLTDPAAAVLTDITITQTVPFLVINGDIHFNLTLGPRQTRVVQVSGGEPPATSTPTRTPTSTTSALPFGVAYGEGSDNLDHFMTYVREIGVRRSKVSFYWSKLEPQAGRYDFVNLDEYLHQLGPDDRALINVFTDGWCTNGESPKGATFRDCPYGEARCEKSCKEYYRDFIRTLAEHVKENAHGGIRYWQRDTEPASARHYPADRPEEYVEAQKIFYETVKSVLPKALVVGVGHNGEFTRAGQPSGADFFDYVIHHAKDYFDLLDIRLYKDQYTIPYRVNWFRERMNRDGYEKPMISTEQGGPDPRTLYDDGKNLYAEFKAEVERDCAGSPDFWECLLRWIREHFDKIHPKLQVFLWPADATQNEKHARMHCHDITQRTIIMLAAGVREMWWWNLQSGGGHPIFGKMRLMTPDYEKLPGYFCYQRMVGKLGGVVSVQRIPLSDDSIYFYRVSKSGIETPLYVVWHRDEGADPYDAEEAPPVSAALQVGFAAVRITDVFGREEVRTVDNGLLTLGISDTPLYIEEATGRAPGGRS